MDGYPRFFLLERGVRQGDPLSPYLFILCAEILANAIKNDPHIIGIKVNQLNFVVSQYADDTIILLDGSDVSLRHTLHLLNEFASISGLNLNKSKTEAFWIGAKAGCSDIPSFACELKWSQDAFSYLGVNFSTSLENMQQINFSKLLDEIDIILNNWSNRYLTLSGKITVVKTLAFSKLVYKMSALPHLDCDMLKAINTKFFNFIWGGKIDRIKRKTLIGPINEGGLSMIDVKSFCNAQKIYLVKKLLDTSFHSEWKQLFFASLNLPVWIKNHLFELEKTTLTDITNISINNIFWKEVIAAWAELIEVPSTIDEILSQTLWFNTKIQINSEPVFYYNWSDKNVNFIKDLLDVDGKFYNYDGFQKKFQIAGDQTNYDNLIESIPRNWIETINNQSQINNSIPHPNIEFLLKKVKKSKCIYKIISSRILLEPTNCQQKWETAFNEQNIPWKEVYPLAFTCTLESRLRIFQYKILHRILGVNKLLFKIKKAESPLCSFCNLQEETLEHLFWECPEIKNFWERCFNFMKQHIQIINSNLSLKSIILGFKNCMLNQLGNHLLLIAKEHIFHSRLHHNICFDKYLSKIQSKSKYHTEKFIAKRQFRLEAFEKNGNVCMIYWSDLWVLLS